MKGWRGIFTCLLVKMFTTDGIALFAAALNEGWRAPETGTGLTWAPFDSVMVTTPLPACCVRRGSRSGRRVETTSSNARAIVVAWANTNHNLRI